MKGRSIRFLCCLSLLSAAAAATAGVNAGGTLVAHNPGLAYTTDTASYCGAGNLPSSCASVNTNLQGSSSDNPVVWKIYAAFPVGGSPRLKAVTWGVSYDADKIVITHFGNCCGDPNNGAVEVQTANWPASGTGTTIGFQTTQTTNLVECYWFAGYNYAGTPSLFSLIPNPTPGYGGNFSDDSNPPAADPIAGFGSLGFDANGTAACPASSGACCDLDHGTCSVLSPSACSALAHGSYVGGTCDPGRCPTRGPCCLVGQTGSCVQATPDSCTSTGNLFDLCGRTCPWSSCQDTLGACCAPGPCFISTRSDCIRALGIWSKQRDCSPTPCEVPTANRTWGRIKAVWR